MEVIQATDLSDSQWQLTLAYKDGTTLTPGSRLISPLGVGAVMAVRNNEIDLLFYAADTATLPTNTQTLELEVAQNTGWHLPNNAAQTIIIGSGLGIADAVHACRLLRTQQQRPALVILQSERPFPFRAEPSRIMVNSLPPNIIATMPLLEDWKIACRLASLTWQPGCHEGEAKELKDAWLAKQQDLSRWHSLLFN